MDSGSHKLYHVHDFDSRSNLDTYYSNKPENIFREDSLKFPMERLHNLFKEGHIKGDLLIDISAGSTIHHLYTASRFFQQISVLKHKEQCMMELNRWINTRTGAFDWTHATTYITELEQDTDPLHEQDMRLKAAIVKTVKCDLGKENITDPVVLPPADCVISYLLCDVVSKDRNEYIGNMKKITKLLKPGGHMIIFGILNATYVTSGKHRYHVLKYDEDFAKTVLIGEGFIIDRCEIQKRHSEAASDLTDYKGFMFITAHKENKS